MRIDHHQRRPHSRQTIKDIHQTRSLHEAPPAPHDRVTPYHGVRTKRILFKRFFFILSLVAIVASGIFIYQIFFSKSTTLVLQPITRLPVIREIRSLVGANDGQLKGISRDRINVLVLGQGGPGHEGPYLTDTIILASFKPSTGDVALLSIPRDMVISIPGFGLDRINAVNAYGETSGYPGGGTAFVARIIEDTIKQPINYYIRVDFNSFINVINRLGGVELTVDQAFTDYQYPDNNYGYQVVNFEAGPQVMNGDQALKYVRSRHALNEGSDFARSRRQQKVLVALKDKILTPSNLLNPDKLTDLYEEFQNGVVTNLQAWEVPVFLALTKNANFDTISFKVLDDSPAGPLYATTLNNGSFVLAPKIPDYSEIAFIGNNLFTLNDIKQEQTTVVIQNGTREEGLALNTAEILKVFEFTVVSVTNAQSTNYKKTILYDLSGGNKPNSRKFLEGTLQTKSQKSLPIVSSVELERADFLIILGEDQVPDHQTVSSSMNSSL